MVIESVTANDVVAFPEYLLKDLQFPMLQLVPSSCFHCNVIILTAVVDQMYKYLDWQVCYVQDIIMPMLS